MSRPVLNLLWKEWREQRWKLVLGSVVLSGLCGIGLWVRLVPDQEVVGLWLFVGTLIWPVFVAMGLVAYERGEGSLHSLLALPVRGSLVLLVKLIVGTVVCLGPLAVSAAVALLALDRRPADLGPAMAMGLAVGVIAFSLMFWTVCFSVRQPTEARAGLVGIVVMLVLALGSSGAGSRTWGYVNPAFVADLAQSIFNRHDAHSIAAPFSVAGRLAVFAIVQCVIGLALFLLAAVRLPREARSRI